MINAFGAFERIASLLPPVAGVDDARLDLNAGEPEVAIEWLIDNAFVNGVLTVAVLDLVDELFPDGSVFDISQVLRKQLEAGGTFNTAG